MKVNIVVDVKEVSNPRRGYHNYDATIKFEYLDESTYIVEKEIVIVEAITGSGDKWMWHKATSMSKGLWTVNYGYDSGD